MKVIYPDLTVSIAADEEDSDWPVSNTQDDYPGNVWKATSRTAELTIVAGAGANAVAVFNTNATSVTMISKTGNEVAWRDGTEWRNPVTVMWREYDASTYSVYDLTTSGVGAFWAEYTDPEIQHTVYLSFVSPSGTVVQAGVVRVGTVNSFRDPKYGLKEGLIDYSIVKELNNGARYYRKRNIVRTFSGQLLEDRDVDFYKFMLDIAQTVGPAPLAWRVSTNKTNWEWVVYAALDGMPGGSHDYPSDSLIDFSLIEMI